MSCVSIRPGTVADAISLAPRLRDDDREELLLSQGDDLEKTLKDSVESSYECFAAELDGKVIALWGIALVPEKGWGIPWMLGSPESTQFPLKLVSIGKEAVSRWEPLCDVMTNLTYQGNVVHHRWLERIGFQFAPQEIPVGDSQAPFRQFYRHSKHV